MDSMDDREGKLAFSEIFRKSFVGGILIPKVRRRWNGGGRQSPLSFEDSCNHL